MTDNGNHQPLIINHFAPEPDRALGPITDLVLPRELEGVSGGAFRNIGVAEHVYKTGRFQLTNVVINCENLTRFNGTVFARQFGVRNMVLNIPNCEELRDSYGVFGPCLRDADFSQWDFSRVKKIGPQWFYDESPDEWRAAERSNGAIKFPSLETLSDGVFTYRKGIAAFELGAGTGKLKTIGNRVFFGTCATNYVMGCASDMTVDPEAFSNIAAVARFTFLNHPPKDAETMDRIVRANGRDAMAKVYVSRMKCDVWGAYCVPAEEIDDEEVRGTAAALGAAAAFKNAAGEWKAFIFPQSMPFDPKGTLLLIR